MNLLKVGFVSATLSLVVLSACGGGGSKGPAKVKPTPTPSATPEASPEPTTEPSPSPEATKPEPPKPTPVTPEGLAARAKECFDLAMAKNFDAYKDCYTADAVETTADDDEPPRSSSEAIIDSRKRIFGAVPDAAHTLPLLLVSGNDAVHVIFVTGTHSQAMQTPMGELPATGKKIGFGFAYVGTAVDGIKFSAGRQYIDPGTVMGQLGISKAPHRAAAEPPAMADIVISAGNEAEAKNLAAFKAGQDAFFKKDWKTLGALYDKISVFSDAPLPADIKGDKKILAHFKELHTAFPDVNGEVGKTWAAGDYVVAELTFKGTNKGAWKSAGIKKPTGKAIEIHALEIFKFKDGKVTNHWIFDNGMAMAMQLGLVPPMGAPPAAPSK